MLVDYHFSWNTLLLVMFCFILNCAKFYFLELNVKNIANLTSLAKVTDGHMSPSNALIIEGKGINSQKVM